MKIEAVFQKFLRISETNLHFWVRKQLNPIVMVKKNSNKNISNLFKANIMKIMYEHMVTECGIS